MTRFAIFLSIACITARAWQAPVFQSETKMVLVDAVVTGKKGDYIRDLTAKDFHVWEDNREQKLQLFPSHSLYQQAVVLWLDGEALAL